MTPRNRQIAMKTEHHKALKVTPRGNLQKMKVFDGSAGAQVARRTVVGDRALYRLGLFLLQCHADDRRAWSVEEFVKAGVALRADGDTKFCRLDRECEVDGLVLSYEGMPHDGRGVPAADRGDTIESPRLQRACRRR
ncbi:hypothetical protein [Streptomyces sp. NPDC002845]